MNSNQRSNDPVFLTDCLRRCCAPPGWTLVELCQWAAERLTVETTTEPLFPEGVFRAKDGNCVQRESAAGDTPAKPARDADHCDFPDCEQHYRYIAMQLDGYALHRHECARLRNADPDSPTYGKCTCGLDELLKSLNDSPEKHQEGKGP